MNEAQMLLHTHPLNDEREARGQLRVGSLWWWGGGRWPEFAAAQVDRVIGGPRWARAACEANGVSRDDAAAEWQRWIHRDVERVLCILRDDWESPLDSAQCLVEWDEWWLRPLSRALEDGKLDTATIQFGWEERLVTVRCTAPQRSRWQRWLGMRARDESRPVEESLRSLIR
jgi:hypothetical protein